MGKRILRNARNSVGISSSQICVSDHSLWFRRADRYSLGRASGNNSAELTWKYFTVHVCLKYGLQLVGFPRKEICDPSNLSVRELHTLQESLQNGTCSFKPLPDEERDALQAMVDEQERSGKNPMGKRKRRNDAGKPRKKARTLTSTEQLGSTDTPPPSCSSPDHENHEIQFDFDEGISGTHTESEPPQRVVHQRSLNEAAPHSSSGSAHVAVPAHRSVGHDDTSSESGEDEVAWRDEDDPIPHLARCIESFGDDLEWDTRDN